MENEILYKRKQKSILGFGVFRVPDGIECKNIVKEAIKQGYRHIDTAEAYGNEKSVGLAINECIKEGIIKREDIFVTTKLNPHRENPGYEDTIDAILLSLKKLNIGYIDLYLIHWPVLNREENWKTVNCEIYKAMEEMHEKGYLKAIGVSNFLIHHLKPLLETAEIMPVLNQLELHPCWQQEEIVNFCFERGIAIEAYSPLLNGKLLNNKLVLELSEKYNKTPSQILLKWSLQKGFIPVCKTKNPARMKENLDILDFEILKDDFNRLNDLNYTASSGTHPDNQTRVYELEQKVMRMENLLHESFREFNANEKYSFLNIPLLKVRKYRYSTKIKILFCKIPILKFSKSKDGLKVYLLGFIPLKKVNKKKNYFKEHIKNHCKRWYQSALDHNFMSFWYEKLGPLFMSNYFYLRYLIKRKPSVMSLDFRITTRCTLKCKECNHFMPLYTNETHEPLMTFEEFREKLDKLLQSVDLIYRLTLLGGETLLNKDLAKMLDYARSKKQIQHIHITTNGTIIPDIELINSFTRNNIQVYISNYTGNEKLSKEVLKVKEITELFKKYNVKYSFPDDFAWLSAQKIVTDDYSEERAIKNFKNCGLLYCNSLSYNEYHICPVSSYIARNKPEYKFYQGEFVDISKPKKEVTKAFKELFSKPYFKICSCCDFSGIHEVVPARQLNEENIKGAIHEA